MAAGSQGATNIESVTKTGDFQIKIVTKLFKNTWFSDLRSSASMMISKVQYDEKGAEYCDFHPVGTGPFVFQEYVENDHMKFVRNENYWGTKPYLDAVNFLIIVDGTTAQLAFENGEADILGSIAGGGKTANLLKEKGYAVTSRPGGLSISLVPSVTNPDSPLANLKVREAIEYALDKEAIAQNVGQGYYSAWYQMAGGVQKIFDPNFKGRTFNLETAKALLAEAGYENGFTTKLICGTNLAGDELAIIQAMLAKVNITIEIETCSINQWIDYETNGWPEGLLESPNAFTELYGIDVNRYFWTPTAPNWADGIYWDSLYRTPELQALCVEYFALPLGDEEVAKGKEIVNWLFANCSFIPLWDAQAVGVRQQWVKDFSIPYSAGPIGWNYTGTWLAKH
jgi:ABC-type transport system substrate-binding protein